ncbi:MAG: UPF0175 family protein [Methanocellales archaeon]|nr:UPF0175 family protein [Methanocellales archaeon]MDI6902122.1 UPF0175 family protein [Methanocellales archaeon]
MSMEKSEILALRTTPEVERSLDKLAALEARKKSDEIRFVLEIGIKERLREIAMEKYMKGEITLEKAAEIAEISVWEMVELLQEKKIAYNLDTDAILESL